VKPVNVALAKSNAFVARALHDIDISAPPMFAADLAKGRGMDPRVPDTVNLTENGGHCAGGVQLCATQAVVYLSR
jgi:hypothetical protein